MKIMLKVLLVFALASGVARADTPLIDAIKSRNFAEAIRLIEGGADVNDKDDEHGGTPLHWARSGFDAVDVVDSLISNGADVNAKDNYGYVPLHSAGFGVAALLINNGADVNAKNKIGITPLHAAFWWLINADGFDDAPDTYNATFEIFELLINNGADVNAKLHSGDTPLCIAKLKGDSKMATALKAAGGIIERGAPPPDGAQEARRKWKKCEK